MNVQWTAPGVLDGAVKCRLARSMLHNISGGSVHSTMYHAVEYCKERSTNTGVIHGVEHGIMECFRARSMAQWIAPEDGARHCEAIQSTKFGTS